MVPRSMAEAYSTIALSLYENALNIATALDEDSEGLQEFTNDISVFMNVNIGSIQYVTLEQINAAIQRYYPPALECIEGEELIEETVDEILQSYSWMPTFLKTLLKRWFYRFK